MWGGDVTTSRENLLAVTRQMQHELEDSGADLYALLLQLQKTVQAKLAVDIIEISLQQRGAEKVAAELAAQLIGDGALFLDVEK